MYDNTFGPQRGRPSTVAKIQAERNAAQRELDGLMERNNPDHEPVGPFTGRCARCGSSDLWDDNLAYGCNKCGAILGGN